VKDLKNAREKEMLDFGPYGRRPLVRHAQHDNTRWVNSRMVSFAKLCIVVRLCKDFSKA
jgi:hypothetical protein